MGFDQATVASGCVYADLDNDGDLELITNNLNEPSRIYKNTQQENNPKNFVRIKLKGSTLNSFGIGAKVTVKANQNIQTQEVSPTHGFQSSSIGDLLFALPNDVKNCEVEIKWVDGKTQKMSKVSVNQLLTIDYAKATHEKLTLTNPKNGLLTATKSLDYQHIIAPINNFDRQVMLPTHYSYTGPKMAVGDVNLDGIDDVFICGTTEKGGTFYLTPQPPLQLRGGVFGRKTPPLNWRGGLGGEVFHNNQDAVIQDFKRR